MKTCLIFVILLSFFAKNLTAQEKDVFDIARFGNYEEMKELIKSYPDSIEVKNNAGFTPLILACYRANLPVANLLIENVKDIDYLSPQGTALAASIFQNQTGLVENLIKNGADVNLADKNGISPLILAIQVENIEMVKLLLKNNADKEQVDKKGVTPFEHAIRSKNKKIINILTDES